MCCAPRAWRRPTSTTTQRASWVTSTGVKNGGDAGIVLASHPSGSVVADDVHGAGGTSIEMVPPSLFAAHQIAWFLPASTTMSFRQRRPLVSFRLPEFSKLQTSEGQGPPMQRHAP